jgi:hypothetical protein
LHQKFLDYIEELKKQNIIVNNLFINIIENKKILKKLAKLIWFKF